MMMVKVIIDINGSTHCPRLVAVIPAISKKVWIVVVQKVVFTSRSPTSISWWDEQIRLK